MASVHTPGLNAEFTGGRDAERPRRSRRRSLSTVVAGAGRSGTRHLFLGALPAPHVPEADLLLRDARQVATPAGEPPVAGQDQGRIETIEGGTVAIRDGEIAAVGPTEELAGWSADQIIDCSGCTLLPGFVDAHTHLAWAGDRADELTLKLQGASYQEILEAGGGIHSTVAATRSASQEQLIQAARGRLDRCLAQGTTTLEAKSGYALTLEGELGLLEVVAGLDDHPIELVSTLLGAHAIPQEGDRSSFVEMVCEALTPAAAEQGLARFSDVFVDEGAFTVEEGRQVLEAGRDAGLDLRIHADELACTRATDLGLELGCRSIDHMNQVHPRDIERFSSGEGWRSTATLCPVTPFTSELPYAPARTLIEADVPVALGSDLNPNAWSEGMLFTMALAVHGMRMTPAEALAGATVNSAWSLGLEDRGRLAPGMLGDVVVLEMPRYEYLGYRMASNPVRHVIKEGQVVAGARDR